jgi:hypothetical protein
MDKMDKDELSKCRAEVIERFINIEWMINAIICQHYLGQLRTSFLFEVLADEYFSFGLKRRILTKIIKSKNADRQIAKRIIKDINELSDIRNRFAHYGQKFIVSQDKTLRQKVIDPRNIKDEIDFQGLHDKFMEKVKGVEEYLVKLQYDLGVKLISELPETQ